MSKGQAFNKNSINRILLNEKYIGTYRHGDIVIENGIPSIVDKVLFDKVQTLLKSTCKARPKTASRTEYILTGKLFCGHCGEKMTGICGTGKTNKKHYYYICNTRKEKKECDKANEKKEWLENVVIKTTLEQVLTDENIEMIATKVIELVNADMEDTSEIEHYKNELKDIKKRMNNILDAMEQGVVTATTKNRLAELESYENDILANLERLAIKKPNITKEQIMYWLESFRYGDIDDVEYKKKIVNTLIHSVYVYDTDGGNKKIVLNFNTTNNSQIEVECSSFDATAPPTSLKTNTLYIYHGMFSFMVEIEKDLV